MTGPGHSWKLLKAPRAPPSFPVCPGSLPVRAGAGGQGSGWAGPFVAWVRARGSCRSWATSDRWDHREGSGVPSEGVCRCQGGGPGAGNRESRLSEFSRVSPRLPPPNSGPGRRHSQGWGGCQGPCRAKRERGVNPWAGEWQGGGRRLPAWPLCPSLCPAPGPAWGMGGQRTQRPGSRVGRSPCPWPLAQARAQGLRNAAKGGARPLRCHRGPGAG